MHILGNSLCISSRRSGGETLVDDRRLRSPSRKKRPLLLSFLATCSPGLEIVLAKELQSPAVRALNVRIGSDRCGGSVHFHGDWEVGFNAALWLRCSTRILHLVAVADLAWEEAAERGIDPLYDFVRNAVEWRRFLQRNEDPGVFRSFSMESSVRDCSRNSSAVYASASAEAAIRDAAEESGATFSDSAEVDVSLLLFVVKDKAMLYRDMSGLRLDKRTYSGENLDNKSLSGGIAAGILTIAGWNIFVPGFGEFNKNSAAGASVLLDPMCGSGTLLIEAALMSCNIAPGIFRRTWPFMNWHDFDQESWEYCCLRARNSARKAPQNLQLLGNDKDEAALSLCEQEAEKAGVKHLLHLSCKDLKDFTPASHPSLVTINPPWGERLYREKQSLISTYSTIGKFLKQWCNESDVYVLSSSRFVASQLRLKADHRWPITVEGMDFRLLHYYILPPKPET